MPKIRVVKSGEIKKSTDQVFAIISDMSQWPAWSPWLIMDPEAKIDVSEDHQSYAWNGPRVGSGHMKIAKISGQRVDYDLQFLAPFKSKAKVTMEVKSNGEHSTVYWTMDSTLPWFMFWMKKMMSTYIGMDYDRGLALLKDYAEDGEIHSTLQFVGEQDFPAYQYIGITRSTTIDMMPTHEKEDFEKLIQFALQHEGMDHHQAFAMYHEFNPVKNKVRYTAGIPTSNASIEVPDEYKIGQVTATKVYTIRHIGPYHHLANAWTAFQMMIRNKELKINKSIPPFETYGNSPTNTHPHELVTNVHFALK